jgi:hypothetical protein
VKLRQQNILFEKPKGKDYLEDLEVEEDIIKVDVKEMALCGIIMALAINFTACTSIP